MEEKIGHCINFKSGHDKISQAKIEDKQQSVQKDLQIIYKGSMLAY